jgi:hypothetical protein
MGSRKSHSSVRSAPRADAPRTFRASIEQTLLGDPGDMSVLMDRALRSGSTQRSCAAFASLAESAARATQERHERLVPAAEVLGPLP